MTGTPRKNSIKELRHLISEMPEGYLASMTWGVMPSDDLFEIALADGWHMDLKGQDAVSFKVAMEMAGLNPEIAQKSMSTVKGMKQVIEALATCASEDPDLTDICENAQSLAGSIMEVLGFEWI
jgi:hypothetical protein